MEKDCLELRDHNGCHYGFFPPEGDFVFGLKIARVREMYRGCLLNFPIVWCAWCVFLWRGGEGGGGKGAGTCQHMKGLWLFA